MVFFSIQFSRDLESQKHGVNFTADITLSRVAEIREKKKKEEKKKISRELEIINKSGRNSDPPMSAML